MTVTVRKLASVIQARKFGNPPAAKKSIEDRKRTSHCAACGQVGHWKGDPACAASSTKGSNKGQSSDGGKGGKNRPFAKSVRFMSHHYLTDDEEAADDAEPSHASRQVFVASTPGHERHEVYLADATRAAGYVIYGHCVSKNVCGTALGRYPHHQPVHLPLQELFEFGKGPTVKSEYIYCFPAGFGGQVCVLAPCILSASIPCLASQPWMTDVGAVIDLAGRQVVFGKLNATAPLLMINGHIAIDVMQFKVSEH